MMMATRREMPTQPDGHCQGLGAYVSGHVQNQGLEADDHREDGHHTFEGPYHRGNHHAQEQQDDQPRETLFDAVVGGFVQIFFCGQAGQFCVVLAHLIVHRFHCVLGGDDADDSSILIQNREGVLRVILDRFDAVRDFVVVRQVRISGADDGVQGHVFPGDNQIFQIDGTEETLSVIHHVQGGDVVLFSRLLHQLVHGLANGQAAADADVIGGNQAADFIFIIGVNEPDCPCRR